MTNSGALSAESRFILDPLDYDSRTHHSQVDALDKVYPEDLK